MTAWLRKRPLSTPEIVVLATTVVLAVPFFLPEMHERYFYLADVLTIVMAFYVRRYWPVAVLVSACSLLSYAPFLWNKTIVALPLVAFGEFLAVIATGLFVAIVGAAASGGCDRRRCGDLSTGVQRSLCWMRLLVADYASSRTAASN